MNDDDAIKWADKKRKTEKSDGCTLAPDFNFRECCERHDMMRRFNVGISAKQADRLLRECIVAKGHPIKSWIYWFYVRYSSLVGGWQNAIAIIVIPVVIWSLWKLG